MNREVWDLVLPASGNGISDRRGFALVLMISLLAFLVVVLSVMSTLTKIEYSVIRTSGSLGQARQNALTGLDVAIGRLQEVAGSDMIITARAERLDTDPNTPDVEGIFSPMWTGVWDVPDLDEDPSTLDLPITWLVSGNQSIDPLRYLPEQNPDHLTEGFEFAWVVTEGKDSNGTVTSPVGSVDQTVRIPKVSIKPFGSDTPTGSFGYWVSDEGLKANARSFLARDSDPDLDIFDDRRQDWDQQRLPRLGYELALPEMAFPGSVETEVDLERIFTYSQLGFLPDGNGGTNQWRNYLRRRFHDVTVFSKGLLVNTTYGRFREDVADPLCSAPFKEWFDLGTNEERESDPNSADFHKISFDWDLDGADPSPEGYEILRAPVVTELEILIGFDLGQGSTNSLTISLRVELWNPYNVVLRNREGGVEFSDIEIAISNLPEFEFSWPSAIERQTVGAGDLVGGGGSGNSVKLTFPIGAAFEPGEVRGYTGKETVSVPAVDVLGFAIPNDEDVEIGIVLDTGANELLAKAKVAGTLMPFSRQTYDPLGAESGSWTGRVFWRMNCGISSPDEFDASRPFPDPRSWHLRNPDDPLVEDPIFIRSEIGTLEELDETFLSKSEIDQPGGFFASGRRFCLFDLPVRPILSLGFLNDVFQYPATGEDTAGFRRFGSPLSGADADLFDEFFVSGLDYEATTSLEESLKSTPYLTPFRHEDGSLPPMSEVEDHFCAQIGILGAFNVNSTSVEAWKAVLSGTGFDQWAYIGGAGVPDEESRPKLDHAFFRFPHTASNIGMDYIADISDLPEANQWVQGIRDLSEGEVEELAVAVVAKVKEFGPFRSLAAFVRLGVIESAIEEVTTINSGLPYFATSRLTQSDVIGNIAPILSARTDSFLIRSYGDSINAVTGAIEARAWCEAVVQRLPEYVDPSDDPEGEPTPGSVNDTFGRRFEIVYFRWLSPDDI